MKKATILIAMFVLCFMGLSQFAPSASAWDEPGPPGGGLQVYVEKATYRVGEPVRFMLYKHAGVDDMPANLEGSYYVIEYREGNRGVEFYTSRKNPLGTTLNLETERIWRWNQKDNERTHEAQPGRWRIKFYAPRGNISKPLVAAFSIR